MSINYKRVEVLVEEDILKQFKRKLIDQDDDMSSLIRKWIKKYINSIPPVNTPEIPVAETNSVPKGKSKKPTVPELKEVMIETEKKYAPAHDYGPDGTKFCFLHGTPHKDPLL